MLKFEYEDTIVVIREKNPELADEIEMIIEKLTKYKELDTDYMINRFKQYTRKIAGQYLIEYYHGRWGDKQKSE